jgi:hypothetical protein
VRTYVGISGAIFGCLAIAHAWRVAVEGPALVRDPLFAITTLTAASLSLWSWRLLTGSRRT